MIKHSDISIEPLPEGVLCWSDGCSNRGEHMERKEKPRHERQGEADTHYYAMVCNDHRAEPDIQLVPPPGVD